jgi:hypothetical protein
LSSFGFRPEDHIQRPDSTFPLSHFRVLGHEEAMFPPRPPINRAPNPSPLPPAPRPGATALVFTDATSNAGAGLWPKTIPAANPNTAAEAELFLIMGLQSQYFRPWIRLQQGGARLRAGWRPPLIVLLVGRYFFN